MGGTGAAFSGGGAAADMDALLFLAYVGGGTWLLVGIVFLVVGIVLVRSRKKSQRSCTAMTTGTVVDISYRAGRDGVMYSPLFQYEVNGLVYVKEPSVSKSRISYAIGEPVEVRYNPADPHECYLPRDKTGKTLSVVFTAVGAGCLVIGIAWTLIFLTLASA